MILIIGLILAIATVSFDIRMPIRIEHRHKIELIMPPDVAARLTGSYRNMMAVFSWIRLISYYGGTSTSNIDISYINKDLETIVAMNPRAVQAYYMGGVAMPWLNRSTVSARKLLARAMRVFPKDWRWPYYLGFDIYFFDHNKVEAAHYLTLAASKKGVPPVVVSLALRMQASGHDLDTAMAVIDQLLHRKQDASMVKTLETQRKEILTEKILRRLDAILTKLPPASKGENRLQHLKQYAIPIPSKLPDGGHIIVSWRGQLVSSVSRRRFQVFSSPGKRH